MAKGGRLKTYWLSAFEGSNPSPRMMIPRIYQQELFYKAREKNSLIVLPTGAGKTLIAKMLATYRLKKFGGKVLMLAPTKPLCIQHKNFFGEGEVLTGAIDPKKRREIWDNNRIIFATPQTIENDILSSRISLYDVSLVVFDEAHRGVGEYSYVFIAREYMKVARNPLILGLTASPGDSEEKIREVCKNLFISQILYKSEYELRDYLHNKKINRIYVELPENIKEIMKILKRVYKKKLKDIGVSDVKKRDLIEMQKKFLQERDYKSLSNVAEAIKVAYAIELIETQGVRPLKEFFKKLMKESRRVKASKRLLDDLDFREAMRITFNLKTIHPKYTILREIIERYKGKKKIIFTQYRKTAENILENIKDICKPVIFIGQRGGMSQKKQNEVLEKFKRRTFDTLVCTSIGEEGLHIDKADVGIFFEPVPSALRMVQRRGRIGRTNVGEIYVLIAKGTIDEKYYWISKYKERKMREALKNFGQQNLKEFTNLI